MGTSSSVSRRMERMASQVASWSGRGGRRDCRDCLMLGLKMPGFCGAQLFGMVKKNQPKTSKNLSGRWAPLTRPGDSSISRMRHLQWGEQWFDLRCDLCPENHGTKIVHHLPNTDTIKKKDMVRITISIHMFRLAQTNPAFQQLTGSKMRPVTLGLIDHSKFWKG